MQKPKNCNDDRFLGGVGVAVLEAGTGKSDQDLSERVEKILTPALHQDHTSLLLSLETPDFLLTSAATIPHNSSGCVFTAPLHQLSQSQSFHGGA